MASHLVGGEFQVRAKGNFRYDIELHVYGDVANLVPGAQGNEDIDVAVGIFSKKTNRVVEVFRMPLVSTSSVPYINRQCVSGSISTKILKYRLEKELSPSLYGDPAGYYIVWERCCRNRDISNIMIPGNSGLLYYAEIPPVIANRQPFINSLPVFPPIPPDHLCVDELFQYSMKATDADGDQLVYSLSEPIRGHSDQALPRLTSPYPAPYPLVFWQSGYGINDQILGNPKLTINSQTGLLTVKPAFSGLFVFAITCAEYRNGVKIGEVRRDVQVLVNNCQTNKEPKITLRAPGTTRDYMEGDTLLVTDATNHCFPITFSDPDVGQTVQLKAIPVNFSGTPNISPASFKVERPNQVFTSQICWPDCNINSPNQLYKVKLVITDDACGAIGSDTLELTFRVIPKPNARPIIALQEPGNTLQLFVDKPRTFNLLSTDADNDQLEVRMIGLDFDPVAEGMQLEPVSGKGQVLSRFTWTANCTNLNRQGPYELQFIVKDNSCFSNHTDTVQVRLQVNDVPRDTVEFLPPNIFTPNGDGRNDTFVMPTLPTDNCQDTFQEIQIYSRWGTRVFQSADRQFAWDGRNVSDGVYYYHIRYGKKQYKGHVSILR
ncbi:T9SS type B sorting domain-containing protein [Adhaeribacter soli]|uniref:T9SS type B sorting domain-containing protein n=1 Tax=Adhaeribacter soli TaxID=2607655 RepID=UPI0017863FF6|nr:gliding motility-associated C-terminal domain-containing protein [Adhaeribacter soli]